MTQQRLIRKDVIRDPGRQKRTEAEANEVAAD
jgi:hypothetical protein